MSTTIERRFILQKHSLCLILVRNGNTYAWTVLRNYEIIGNGQLDSDGGIPAVLKLIVDSLDMGSTVMDIELRALTWTALPGYTHLPALELKPGMVVGGLTRKTVQSAKPYDDTGIMLVQFEGEKWIRRFPVTQLCNVA